MTFCLGSCWGDCLLGFISVVFRFYILFSKNARAKLSKCWGVSSGFLYGRFLGLGRIFAKGIVLNKCGSKADKSPSKETLG